VFSDDDSEIEVNESMRSVNTSFLTVDDPMSVCDSL